jgi:hypothetical protein
MSESSSLQRINVYLDCLRKEFELLSNATPTKSPSSSRFNTFLGNLKSEVELVVLEIEGYKGKGTYFVLLSWYYLVDLS